MWKVIIVGILFVLTAGTSSASDLLCWDGMRVYDHKYCDPKPEPVEISIKGIPAHDGILFAYFRKGEIVTLNLKISGETGLTDRWLIARRSLSVKQEGSDLEMSHRHRYAFDIYLDNSNRVSYIEPISVELDKKDIQFEQCWINLAYKKISKNPEIKSMSLRRCR